MTSDAYTRILLAVLAVLLGVLVAQGLRKPGSCKSHTPTTAQSDVGRFVVSGIRAGGRGGTTLLRTDTIMGTVWKANPTGASRWQLVTEPLELEPLAAEGGEESDAEPSEAPDAE